MAPTTTAARSMTPLARYLDSAVTGQGGLDTFLAVRRIPGPYWMTFDEIADELSAITESTVNRVSVKTFADKAGIPDTRYIDGRKMPREVPQDAIATYFNALPKTLADTTRKIAGSARLVSQVKPATSDAQRETDAILADPDTMAAIAEGEAEIRQLPADDPTAVRLSAALDARIARDSATTH